MGTLAHIYVNTREVENSMSELTDTDIVKAIVKKIEELGDRCSQGYLGREEFEVVLRELKKQRPKELNQALIEMAEMGSRRALDYADIYGQYILEEDKAALSKALIAAVKECEGVALEFADRYGPYILEEDKAELGKGLIEAAEKESLGALRYVRCYDQYILEEDKAALSKALIEAVKKKGYDCTTCDCTALELADDYGPYILEKDKAALSKVLIEAAEKLPVGALMYVYCYGPYILGKKDKAELSKALIKAKKAYPDTYEENKVSVDKYILQEENLSEIKKKLPRTQTTTDFRGTVGGNDGGSKKTKVPSTGDASVGLDENGDENKPEPID